MSPQWLLMLALVPAVWLPAAVTQMGDTAAWDAWVYDQVAAAGMAELADVEEPSVERGSIRVVPAAALTEPAMRELLGRWFPPDQIETALRVSWCESRWVPSATNPASKAAGLFQHMPAYWESRSEAALGHVGDPHDPEANVAVAAWLWATGGWGHWQCRPDGSLRW